jgi:hypothetical protein
MTAIVSNGRLSDITDVREHVFAATAKETALRIDGTGGELRTARSLALVVHRIEQMVERRRHAEIARRNGPLSLDDAWAGGWYARSRILQEALLQRQCSASATPAPPRQDWVDKLD